MQRKIIEIIALVALLIAAMPSVGLAAPAQQSNLLTNPGFEQPYDDGKQASGWGRWFEQTAKADNYDYVFAPTFSAEVNSAIVRGGSAAQHIGNRYDPWHAGVKQAVSVPAGTPVQFCAYGRLFASNDDFEEAPSWEGHNGHMKVGIFSNGDAEWNSSGIVWSAEANPHNAWQQICVNATVGDAGKVTVFTSSSYRGTSAFHLDAWWDDASLVSVAPAATATSPAPTAAPAPVIERTCDTRDDGSVVYVVQSGDTLGAIAISCDSTVETIQQLNGLADTLISVGQTLIVKGPTAPPTAAPQPTAEAAPTEAVEPTPEPVVIASEGEICVQAYNDANANQAQDTGEQLLGGVGFALSDTSGARGSYVTSGLEPEPYCFAGLAPGQYTVEARPPSGVASTTSAEWPVGLTGGMQFKIAYGGSRGAEGAAPVAPDDTQPAGDENVTPDGGSTSDLGRIALGGVGILILIAAGFMASQVLARARR